VVPPIQTPPLKQ
ncbi:unnamed protein product, partial [Rotaria sp. Silwood1]